MIYSTKAFINICNGYLSQYMQWLSLDVEFLFKNVPINDKTDIVLQHIYAHDTLQQPKILMTTMKRLLKTCKTECPIYSLIETFMFKIMVLRWVHHSAPHSSSTTCTN